MKRKIIWSIVLGIIYSLITYKTWTFYKIDTWAKELKPFTGKIISHNNMLSSMYKGHDIYNPSLTVNFLSKGIRTISVSDNVYFTTKDGNVITLFLSEKTFNNSLNSNLFDIMIFSFGHVINIFISIVLLILLIKFIDNKLKKLD